MKSKKEIINIIKQDAEKVIVADNSDIILQKFKNSQVIDDPFFINQKPKLKIKLRFVLSCVITVMFLLVTSISIISIKRSTEPINTIINNNASNRMGYQAMTLFNYAHKETTKRSRNYTNNEYDMIALNINPYLLLSASILNEGSISYVTLNNDNEYSHNMKISLNVYNYHQEYQFSYNEVKNKENKHEISYIIEGMIISNNTSYVIKGTREISNDECEVDLKLFLDESNNEYIELSQETEKRENEYSYSHYINNKLYEEFEIEHEINGTTNKIEIEVSKENTNYEYEFIYLSNHIETKYEFNNYSGKVKIYIQNNKHRYVFDNYEKII